MIDHEELDAADLIGRRLLRVTAAWLQHDGVTPSLLSLWLHLEEMGPVLFHTPSAGLSLRTASAGELYQVGECGSVSVVDDPPDLSVTRFVGQPIRSAYQIVYRDGRTGFSAGLTLRFPNGTVRLLALDDDLVIAGDQDLGPVEAHLHADVHLARVVQTGCANPSQWDAWTTGGKYLYLRYRHGEGTVEQHPSEDPDTWDGEESRLRSLWNDGTDGGHIELAHFLAMAGLRLAPNADVSSR
ncbi:hypothetical protein [Streptomyces sp. NPDC049585]|uniref:hypothetical protein n=1 Tax=Streptomyces sp. NPDC049585 TaxID=3155154 RepID=UPI00344243C2